MTARDDRPVVYSTEAGFDPQATRQVSKIKSLPPQQQTASLYRERKGRGGKTVTVVRDLQLSEEDLKALATQLKQSCGSGGTVKDGVIEIQGDHRDQVAVYLKSRGYKTKNIGG